MIQRKKKKEGRRKKKKKKGRKERRGKKERKEEGKEGLHVKLWYVDTRAGNAKTLTATATAAGNIF